MTPRGIKAISPARLSLPELEKDFQVAVIDFARLHGWKIAHFADSRRQVRPGVHVGDRDAAGYPDLTMVRERTVWAELKGAKTRVTEGQWDWIHALADAGEEVYLWRPSDWPDIQRVLGGRR